MAKRSKQVADAPLEPALLLTPRVALDKELADRIGIGEELLGRAVQSSAALDQLRNDYDVWNDFNRELLRRRFSTAEIADEYSRFYGGSFSMDPTLEQRVGYVRSDISDKINRLTSIRGRLPLFDEAGSASPALSRESLGTMPGTSVFVVHGRNEHRKSEVARFLEGLGLDAIILHEQPNAGRTVIEKFETYAGRAGFAVVVVTADDEGGLANTDVRGPRARQNVVFELGFFFGKLGRNRVCVLFESGVEKPSDIDGIVYLPFEGEWKLALGRELKAAHLPFDINKLFR